MPAVFTVVLVATAAAQQGTRPRPGGPAGGGESVTTADRIVERFMKEKQIPGLVLAVVRDGRLVVEKGYGVRSLTDRRRPDPDTLFYIGSLVKGLPPAWRSIPLKYFLAHQSGIPEPKEKRTTFADEARTVADVPLSFQPGARQEYLNFNYHVAGQAIESASGRPYLEFMHAAVFRPLGMTRTGYHQADPNSSPGHYLRPGGLAVVREVSPKSGEHAIPAGFLQSTLADLLRFYRGVQGHTLLSAARTREMLAPVTRGKTGTPGWFARPVRGMRLVVKDGAVSGYSSQFQFVPGRGHAVIFIMNLQGKDLGTAALARDLLREVCGVPLPGRPAAGGAGE
jgi:CubicO group peptidase (beta-lactamase class C family)